MSNVNTTLVSKLTLKAIGAQPKRGSFGTEEDQKPAKTLARIFGRALKWDTVTTQLGESYRFHGVFEGINMETGEVFKSGKVFLPGVVASILAAEIDNADGRDIDFAYEIGGRWANGDFGYEYTVKPIIETATADPLAALRNMLPEVVPTADAGAKATGKGKTK